MPYSPSRMFLVRKRIRNAPLVSWTGLFWASAIAFFAVLLGILLADHRFLLAALTTAVGVVLHHLFLARRSRDYFEGLWQKASDLLDDLSVQFLDTQSAEDVQHTGSEKFFDAFTRAHALQNGGFTFNVARVREFSLTVTDAVHAFQASWPEQARKLKR